MCGILFLSKFSAAFGGRFFIVFLTSPPCIRPKNPIFFARFARNFEICLTFSLCIRPKIRFFSRVSRAILEFVHVFPLYMAKNQKKSRASRAIFGDLFTFSLCIWLQNPIFSRASRAILIFFSVSAKFWSRGFIFSKSHPNLGRRVFTEGGG